VDFDQVVLAIPIGALEPICGELIERDQRWDLAIHTAVTVQTQAFQVWLGKPSDALGWPYGENSVTGCYVEPLDTYCDMSHLIPAESWGDADNVRGIAYFCGVLDDFEGETAAKARERVHANAIEFLERDAAGLWPRSRPGPAAGSNALAGQRESGFDWDLLTGTEAASAADHRFSSQYWRANVTPSERYVLTPAGSVKHRLPSNDSGFENLKLAGDWTKNGVDGGCVEAAVTSGMQAARAITGFARPITSQSPRWPQRGPLAPTVREFGGRATAQSVPLAQRQAPQLRARGNRQRIADLVRRTLDEPAGPEVSYRAVGSKVLLMVGASSTSPRWPRPSTAGAVTEIMASLWIPVVAGRDLGDVFLAERFGVTAPYVLVDNPMSYAGAARSTASRRRWAGSSHRSGRRPSGVAAFGGNFGREEGPNGGL
jgi:hypothetical protein